tara:strand:- start:21490 stop:22998 length:1509 start_codon:yes stop_codon:yes gene_type:complete
MKKAWKIGTRGSLLALTQCGQVKDLLHKKTGEEFELVIIKTQGDQQTDKPLWQLEGKDFFTKELDEALLKNEVDLVVHSYKDLGSDRPKGIVLGAIGERRFGHDILLIPNENVRKLQNGEIKNLLIGTSSPRRITNLESHFSSFVPSAPKIETKMLRGNVNTRIQKLRDGDYHAIVLAMPGLERLAQVESSRKELAGLLKDMNFTILPASKFPWAASQGALAVEMHEKNPEAAKIKQILASIHHDHTEQAVKRERKAFNDYGGGCHLAVGVAVMASKDRFVHSHRGQKDENAIELLSIEPKVEKVKAQRVFVGMPDEDKLMSKKPIAISVDCKGKDLFATSSYVFESMKNSDQVQGLWAAGTKTWQKLAAKNYWVNGAADSLGEQQLKDFETSALLQLMRGANFDWLVLSGEEAYSGLGQVVETYERTLNPITEDFKKDIEDTSDFFWTSIHQYKAYAKAFPTITRKRHWCGLGKTYDSFAAEKVNVIAVSGINEFRTLTAH